MQKSRLYPLYSFEICDIYHCPKQHILLGLELKLQQSLVFQCEPRNIFFNLNYLQWWMILPHKLPSRLGQTFKLWEKLYASAKSSALQSFLRDQFERLRVGVQ